MNLAKLLSKYSIWGKLMIRILFFHFHFRNEFSLFLSDIWIWTIQPYILYFDHNGGRRWFSRGEKRFWRAVTLIFSRFKRYFTCYIWTQNPRFRGESQLIFLFALSLKKEAEKKRRQSRKNTVSLHFCLNYYKIHISHFFIIEILNP